jgi:hypothetical protein
MSTDRRKFIRRLASSLLATPLAAWGQKLESTLGKRPKTKAVAKVSAPLSTLAPNTARDLGPYANPEPQFNTPPLSAANITDYSGIAYDPVGKRICVFGGGHGPSQETDIRVLDLSSLQWSSLYSPTPVAEMQKVPNLDSDRGRYISTNQPTARHTYNLTLVRGRSFYMMCPRGMPDHLGNSFGPEQNGWGGRVSYYDFGTGVWTYSRLGSAYATPPNAPWYFASAAALDPVSNKILIVGPNSQAGEGALWLYDPENDDYVTGPIANVDGSPDLVYFPPSGRFYAFQSDGRVWEIRVDRTNFSNSTIAALTVTGARPSNALGVVCGFAYDSVNRIIGGNVTNGVFYAFDPAKHSWTSKNMKLEAGSTGLPNQAFHCLDFDPESGCFIFLQTGSPVGSSGAATTWAYRYEGSASRIVAGSVADLSVTLDFGGGKVATFDGSGAVERGDFVGEFVRQKCYLATDPSFPDWRVWFRVDADSSGQRIQEPITNWRDEVIVEYGRATHGTPLHITSPYTAAIKKVGATKATYTVPKHWWYARWRYQSSERPVVRSPALLRARGWIPNFGTTGMYGGTGASYRVDWVGPMTAPHRPGPAYPFDPAMAAGGDHEEIGHLTESAASYVIFGGANNLATLRTEGEWCSNWCMHIRDDATGSMPGFRDTTTFFKSNSGTINDAPAGNAAIDRNFVGLEAAHWYPCANMPWLLTDDPYFLEELQFGVNWRILWNRTPRQDQNLGGLMYPGETRAFAWGLRDLFQLTASCPVSVPSWLRPRSYWQTCVDDNLKFALKYVNSPARIHSTFRVWTRSDLDSSWQAAWLSAVVGMAIDQGFANWLPVFTWSIQKQIQMTNGTSGWNRQWPAPYYSVPNKSGWGTFQQYPYKDASPDSTTVRTWSDYWNYYASGSDGHSDTTGHKIDTTGWDGRTLMAQFYPQGYYQFFLYLRAALAIAVTRGIPGAQACYDYLHGQLTTAMPQHYKAPGQAKFSIDPQPPAMRQ